MESTRSSYKLSVLSETDRNYLKSKTVFTLPDNPSDKQWSPTQIKKKMYEGTLLLFDWLKKAQEEIDTTFDTLSKNLITDDTFSFTIDLGDFSSGETTEENIKLFAKKLLQNSALKLDKNALFLGTINGEQSYALYDKFTGAIYFHLTKDINDTSSQKYFKDYIVTYNESLNHEVTYIGKVTEDDLDYEKLKNKPSINGITLIGDNSFEELGMTPLTSDEIDKMFI